MTLDDANVELLRAATRLADRWREGLDRNTFEHDMLLGDLAHAVQARQHVLLSEGNDR